MCVVSFEGGEEGVGYWVCGVAGEGGRRIQVFYCCLPIVNIVPHSMAVKFCENELLRLTPLYRLAYFEAGACWDVAAISAIFDAMSLSPAGADLAMVDVIMFECV